jgi:hypothetical protein
MGKVLTPILLVATLGLAQLARAAAPALMVVTCSPPKGVNVAASTESDRPETASAEIFDPEADPYISLPMRTERWTLTVNQDGTATETEPFGNGMSTVSDFRLLGKDENTMSFVLVAGGTANLITLYPKDSIAILAATVNFGSHDGAPNGSVYISHCKFSRVLN